LTEGIYDITPRLPKQDDQEITYYFIPEEETN